MTDQGSFERLLREALAENLGEAPAEHPDRTLACPPLPRFRDLTYRVTTQTPEERAHMAGCRYCQMTLAVCEREAWHPAAERLAEGRLFHDEDRQTINAHLERDGCERCRRLMPLLRAVEHQWESPVIFGGPQYSPLWLMEWQHAEVQAFATERAPRFLAHYPSSDGSVTVSLRTTDAGDLLLYIETQRPPEPGKLWRVAVLAEDEREIWNAFAVLAPWASGQRWAAEMHLGRFAEFRGAVGSRFHILAYSMGVESLTVNDRVALLRSIEASLRDPRAVDSWRAFLAETLGRPGLPSQVVDLLKKGKALLERR